MGDIKTDGGTENIEVFKQEKGNDSLPNGNVEDGLIKETLAENKEPESSKEENESSKKDQLVESGESEDSEKVEPTEYLKRLRSRTSRTTRSSRSSSIELKKDDTPLSTRDSKSDESGVISNLGTPSDEEDFLGFDCPNTTRRDAFLKLIGKKNDVPEKESTNQENMLEIVNDENPLSVESDGISSDSVSKRPLVSKSSKKPASAIINDPKFKKPFEYGWMRELVYRSSGESGLKRSADVYYFTPSGKKLRSVKEVLSYLTEDLTAENFTFLKEPLGVGDKEIVREAKPKGLIKGPEEGLVRKKSTPRVTKTAASPKTAKAIPQAESSSSSNKGSLTPRVVFKNTATIPKNKSPITTKSKPDIKKKKSESDDAEVPDGGDSEWNNSEPKAKTNGVKRVGDSPSEGSSPPPEKKTKRKDIVQDSRLAPPSFMMNLNVGFTALLHAFQFLKVHELLRASCVSKAFEMIAHHESLWSTVRMKNSMVRDWNGFGRALRMRYTKALDLRKMLLPETPEAIAEMWVELGKAVTNLPSLTKIDLGRCTPKAVEIVTNACPQLHSLVTLAIRGSELDLSCCAKCTNLTELKIKSIGGIDLIGLSSLKNLKSLKHLALTTIKNLNGIEEVLPENLESLELGECTNLPDTVANEALIKLTNLKRLRLEKGQGNCPTTMFLQAVAKLQNLVQLELINFDIKPGFDVAIGQCTNLKTLLIIPTYVTQSATTNHVVMGGVSKLSQSLTYFIWGLTLELLRVTDLFIDQVEGQKVGGGKGGNASSGKKPGAGDSIPILKPLTEHSASGTDNPVEEVTDILGREGGGRDEKNTSQVDILALPKLQKVLSTLLPNTKIKILKVPFSATWRQTVTDSPAAN